MVSKMGRQFDDRENLLQNNNGSKSSPCLEDHVSSRLRFLLEDGSKAPMLLSKNPGLPPWFDYELFLKGQRYFHDNYYAFFTAKLSGLLSIMAIPSILRVLQLTNQSTLPVTAFKRYLATLSQMLRWYDGDLLEPTSSAHKSLMEVRARHRSASLRAGPTGPGTGSTGPGTGNISQLDMALTQFGFMGFAIVAPRKLGLSGDQKHVQGFVHFWRTVGFMLGIEDRFNLCSGDVQETRMLCRLVLDHVFVPALQSPPPGFLAMAQALVDGMWTMVPFLDATALFAFTAFLADIPAHSFASPLATTTTTTGSWYSRSPLATTTTRGSRGSWYSRLLIGVQRWIHTALLNQRFFGWLARKYFNTQMWLTVLWTQRWPILAIATFGRDQVESPMTYH